MAPLPSGRPDEDSARAAARTQVTTAVRGYGMLP